MDTERHDKKRQNVEDDRLSTLPYDLIHKILSFISIKHVVQTSALSSKWRFIWTSMPYLNFSTEDFRTLPKFSKFVTHVLSERDNQIEVSSVELSFRGKATQVFVKKILNYAFSHNVQQLTVKCLYDNKDIEFPLSLLSSRSLKHLSFTGFSHFLYYTTITSTWVLPALTTLYLDTITLYDDNIGRLSNCVNLKNLTLKYIRTIGLNCFNISHSQLSNLRIYQIRCDVNVVAPQLKNFSIRACDGHVSFNLSADSVRLLEKVNLICYPDTEYVHKFVALLHQLHNVKCLTLNLEFVELLSSFMELVSCQPFPFANLKSLKIYPVHPEGQPRTKADMYTEVIDFLLDSSPSAAFTLVLREEIMAVKNTTSAQKLISEYRVFLEQEKAKIEIDMGHMLQRNTQPEMKIQPQIGGSTTQIRSCWEDLSLQIEKRKTNACHLLWNLRDIENLLIKLPASNRAMIQPCFSSLCAEADIVMSKITECMKIQCDENQSRLSVCLHEFATALHPTSYVSS